MVLLPGMLNYRLKVSENGVLMRIFGREREDVAGGWRILHNEELHILYTSPNMLRRMRWARQVAHLGVMRNTRFRSENLNGRDHVEDIDIDGEIIVEWILGK